MGILLILVYTSLFLLLCYWLNKKYIKVLPSYTLPLLFLVKIAYAFFFLYVYTYHYGGGELTADAGVFFKESKVLHSVFQQSPYDFFQFIFGLNDSQEFINKYLETTMHWNGGDRFLPNDSRHVIRVNALLLFISNGEVIIHFMFFSFASFMGGFDLFQWLKKKSNIPPLLLLILLTLAPSLAFWSSSIIKEPLMILGLSLFIRGIFDDISISRKTWRIIIGGVLTIAFKPYVFICLIVVLIYYFIFSKFFQKQWKAILAFGIFGISVLVITGYSDKAAYIIANQQEDFINLRDGGLYLHGDEEHYYYIYYSNRDHFSIENGNATLLEPVGAYYLKKNENFERFPMKLNEVGATYPVYLTLNESGSKVKVTLIKDNFWQMLLNIPEAIFNSFLQPIPNKKSTWLQYPAFIENLLYVFAAALTFFLFPKSLSQKEKRIAISLNLFAVFIAMIVGWTTPVSGAIVRYIIPAHVAILVIIALKLDYEKLRKKIFKG
ncbi:hypothetical protein ERX46_04960 [Brumimicrobium glaciale]|uniref:Glycosyltransferase RgtA/B/C/D-like domain-containing protein n=1 Tax=Brumimicrobium glaciale TaxID=200475 RepID=A0A4Q4KPE8_9FLAO|nr:hypothetical protein [Brumimicrobium glaciale]RYM34727.1 hypothetical protein ERX46_04960 [Brumimicrobium glaciale]